MRARLAVTSGLILLATLALPAVAQNVSYSGRMGDRALLPAVRAAMLDPVESLHHE